MNHTPRFLASIARSAVIGAGIMFAIGTLTTTAAEPPSEAEGWVPLIGRGGLAAWIEASGDWIVCSDAELSSSDSHLLSTSPGHGTLVNGPTGRTVNLLSDLLHGDLEAHIEFLVAEGSNSGVYFQGRYEIQILDSWGVKNPESSDCGGIYKRWKNDQGYDGHAPRTNACRRPGVWQTYDVVFRAPRFDADGRKIANARFVKVIHNGVLIHEDVEITGSTRAATFNDEQPRGPLMLQGDHGPVAYRNIKVKASIE